MLGIDLPGQLPEETAAEIDQFYGNQVTHVQNYLMQHKTTALKKYFQPETVFKNWQPHLHIFYPYLLYYIIVFSSSRKLSFEMFK
jgi:hypothetical protein